MQTFSRQTYVDRILEIDSRGGAFRGRADVLINVEGKPLAGGAPLRCTVKFLEVPTALAARLFQVLEQIGRWQGDPDGTCPQCARGCWLRGERCVCGYLDGEQPDAGAAGEKGGEPT